MVMLFSSCSKDDDIIGSGELQDYTPPPTHIYSNRDNTETKVAKVLDDGTVVMEADATDLPKQGDIIVSGVTDAAPYGFLYRVDGVEMIDGKAHIKTSEAYLNEVIKDCDVSIPIELTVIEDENYVNSKVIRKDKEITLFDISRSFEVNLQDPSKVWSASATGSFGIKSKANFIMQFKDWEAQRLGVELDGEASAKLTIKFAGTVKKTLDLFPLPVISFEPFTVWIGPVPVVVRPQINGAVKMDIKGSVFCKFTPFNFKYGLHSGILYTKELDPVTGKHWRVWCDVDDFSEKMSKMFTPDDVEFGISGEIKPYLETYFFAGLYAKGLGMGLGPTFNLSLEGELSMKVPTDEPLITDFKDRADVKFGIELGSEAKAEFKKPFSNDVIGYSKESDKIKVFETTLFTAMSIFPQYKDFEVYPDKDVMNYGTVRFSVNREWFYMPFDEEDWGFCYKEADKSGAEWTYVSLKEKYGEQDHGKFYSKRVECDVTTGGFSPNTKYKVLPYSKVLGFYIRRSGGTFTTGAGGSGGNGSGTITDIPGNNL